MGADGHIASGPHLPAAMPKHTKTIQATRHFRLLLGLATALNLTACATLPSVLQPLHKAGQWFNPQEPDAFPKANQTVQSTSIQNIPFIVQADYHCGPAVLAMMFGQLGIQRNPSEVAEWVYVPGRKGSLQIEMLAAARQPGLMGILIEPNFQAIHQALMAKKPVAVLLNLGLDIYPIWHYALVVGYKAETAEVILHNGEKAFDKWPLYTFNRTWKRANNWGFVLHKPGVTPPSFITPERYLEAATALERSHPIKALNAYRMGANTWPKEAWFDFGAGNVLYSKQQYLDAKTHYQRATHTQPTFADAWNNLAETHLALGQYTEAKNAVNKAIALGGKHLPNYQETARKLN